MSTLEDDERTPPLTLEETRDLRQYLSHLNGNPRLVLQVTPEKFEASGLDVGVLEREGIAVRLGESRFWVDICGPAPRLVELLARLRETVVPPRLPGPPVPKTVHILRDRETLCRRLGFAPEWPPGNSFVMPDLSVHATCEECLRARSRES